VTRRVLLGLAAVLTALLLQTAVLGRLPLPGGAPDLLLVVVVAFALVQGPLSGTVTGFLSGLVLDLGADHELGRAAVVYALVGHGAGLLADERPRTPALPLLVVAAAAAGAVGGYALQGLLLGDPRITGAAFWSSLVGTTTYCVLLTPLVVPVLGALVRRLEDDPLRR